jgi:hypothetical protein
MSRKVTTEIDRRTNDASKLAALQARKVAVLEMVADLMQEAVDLMRNEGFTVALAQAPVKGISDWNSPAQPYVGATVITEANLVAAPVSAIKNPCAQCGQEAHGTEAMPNGGTRYLCKSHYMQRAKEKQEEATTKSLLGSEGTLYQRPQTPVQPVKKILIQAGPDPLLGARNGETPAPPVNHVLDEADD